MQNLIFKTHTAEATSQIAAKLARYLEPNTVIALDGDLGAGKTVFCRGLMFGLAADPGLVCSPTFTLMNSYQLTNKLQFLHHFDVYRLNNSQDFINIGLDEYFNKNNVCLIEWANIIDNILPDGTWHIKIIKPCDIDLGLEFDLQSLAQVETLDLSMISERRQIELCLPDAVVVNLQTDPELKDYLVY